MAKIIHCYPAKTSTLPISCFTCAFRCPKVTGDEVDVCRIDEEDTRIEDPKKWRCGRWELDHNVMLSLRDK